MKNSIRRIWTYGHRPFVMGGSVDYILACDLECTGPHKLGKGHVGYLAAAPNGQTFVAEATSGALVGDTLESVRADIKAGKPSVMRGQIKDALHVVREAKRKHEFEVHPPAFFWKALGCAK